MLSNIVSVSVVDISLCVLFPESPAYSTLEVSIWPVSIGVAPWPLGGAQSSLNLTVSGITPKMPVSHVF